MSDDENVYSGNDDNDDKNIFGNSNIPTNLYIKNSHDFSACESGNMDYDKKVYMFKVILLGNIAVGKTCILNRFCSNSFSSDYKCTVGVEFKVKSLSVDDSTIADLKIWDTCGDEKYRTLTKQYYREANGVILVFDLTQRETFVKLEYWLEDIRINAPEDIIIVLVGNKSDLADTRKVTYKEASEFAQKKKIEYIEVSARMGNNVSLIFDIISKKMIQIQKKKESEEEFKDLSLSHRSKLKKDSPLNLKSNEEKKTVGCC